MVPSPPPSTVSSNGTSMSNSQNMSTTTTTAVSQTYERHVKMLAKVLQTMANMTECKEPYMQPLSEFLGKNKSRIVNFIDQIAATNAAVVTNAGGESLDDDDESTLISENGEDEDEHGCCGQGNGDDNDDDDDEAQEDIQLRLKYAECKYLAMIHRLLSSFLPQMRAHLTSIESTESNEVEFAKSLKNLIEILDDINRKTKS